MAGDTQTPLSFPGCSAEPRGALGSNVKVTGTGQKDITDPVVQCGVAFSASALLSPISDLSSGARHRLGPSGLRLIRGVSRRVHRPTEGHRSKCPVPWLVNGRLAWRCVVAAGDLNLFPVGKQKGIEVPRGGGSRGRPGGARTLPLGKTAAFVPT